jgi:hypothetical protein
VPMSLAIAWWFHVAVERKFLNRPQQRILEAPLASPARAM